MLVAGAWLLAACVGPARTFAPYRADAVATAEEAISTTETALVVVRAVGRDNAYAPYVSVVLADAADSAASAQAQFSSVQPPGPRADRLRRRLDALLTDAVAALDRLRIHARRSEMARLPELAEPLAPATHALEDFVQDYGP